MVVAVVVVAAVVVLVVVVVVDVAVVVVKVDAIVVDATVAGASVEESVTTVVALVASVLATTPAVTLDTLPLMISALTTRPAALAFSQHVPHAKLQCVQPGCPWHCAQQLSGPVLGTLGACGWK